MILHGKSLEVAGTIHLPGTAEWEAPGGGEEEERGGLYLTAQQPPCRMLRSAAL